MSELSDRANVARAFQALKAKVDGAALPASAFAQLSAKLEVKERSHRRTWQMALGVAGIGLAAASVVLAVRPSALPGGFEVVRASADLRWYASIEEGLAVERGQVTLRLKDLASEISISEGSRLRREAEAIRVSAGSATFSVAPRHGQRPVRVLVSHGAIEVVGTLFTVVQDVEGGPR
jgi:ferric-dicitrate binding protein FerR (iron transport regulator)